MDVINIVIDDIDTHKKYLQPVSIYNIRPRFKMLMF